MKTFVCDLPALLVRSVLICGLMVGAYEAGAATGNSPPPAGVAPLLTPAGGLAIDGDPCSNTPVPGTGDWVPASAAPGAGGSILSVAGTPLNGATTFHVVDPYNGLAGESIFGGGLKWSDDPNTWTWTGGKSSSKTDINNVLLHIGGDTNGHVWAVIAADRFSTSGDSYIDFEFLQNTLTKNANGTFSSAGPHGGRTVNDLLLSLAFSGGGKVADFFVWRWLPDGAGGYHYVEATASLPAGRVYASLNNKTVAVPYGAFGETSYDPNAFAEAAVNLTAMLANFDPCLSFEGKTIMVKTKASTSNTASIEDLIDPIHYTLRIGPGANAGTDQIRCYESDGTSFALSGTATPGLRPIASTTWTVVEGSATIAAPNALVTTARLSSSSALLRLTVTQENGCIETDDVRLTVKSLPACIINGPTTICPSLTASFQAPAGMASYLWSVSGDGTIVGRADQPTVALRPGACGGTFTLTLTVSSNGCSRTCTSDVSINDTVPPQITAPADLVLECPADTRTNVTGVAMAQDDCQLAALDFHDEAIPGCGGTFAIARTWTARDTCGNISTALQTITVRDTVRPILHVPADAILECPADTRTNATGMATAQDTCSSVLIQFTDVVTNNCGGSKTILRNWGATDACGNISVGVQRIVVRDASIPIIIGPPDLILDCPADTRTNATGVATARDTCSEASVRYTDSVVQNCGGSKVITRTWTATDECGNSSSVVQTITVRDITKPSLQIPGDVVLECPADTRTNITGTATANDACGTVTLRYTDATTNGCGGAKVIVRMWTATDECGNSTSAAQTITVRDTVKPTLQIPADIVVECPTDPGTNTTGAATAVDGCSAVTVRFSDAVTHHCGGTVSIVRTWTATDACGNSISAAQNITVRDTVKPVLRMPADIVLECPADPGTNTAGIATASDACGAVTVRFTDNILSSCGGARVIARTWSATDECGNSTSAVQTVTVRDVTNPTLNVPPDVVLECGADTSTAATGAATGQDACGRVTIRYTDTVSNGCGNTKTIARRWTATDECGNSASAVQTIATRDTTPPQITCAVVCTYSKGGYSGGGEGGELLIANFASIFPQGLTIGQYHPASGSAKPNGLLWQPTTTGVTALRTFLSSGGGNSAPFSSDAINPTDHLGGGGLSRQTATLTLNIMFNQAGLLGLGPNNFGSLIYSAPADSLNGMTVSQIRDAANRALAGLGLPAGHDFASLNSLIDSLNLSFHNCAVGSFAADHLSTPKVIVQCPSQVPPPNRNFVKPSDNCSSSVTLTPLPDVISNQSGPSCFTIIRTWVAEDACGNRSSCAHTIVVEDTSPPALSGQSAKTIQAGRSWTFDEPIATDNCGVVTVRIVSTETNVSGDFTFAAKRTWEATDGCNNTAMWHQIVTFFKEGVVQSTFEYYHDDWSATDGRVSQVPVCIATGGLNGGYLSAGAYGLAEAWCWSAPEKFLGDLLNYYNGTLQFALKQSSTTSPFQTYDVVLSGDGITLVLTLSHIPNGNWTLYTVLLNEEAGWINLATGLPATQADMIRVLSDVTSLKLRGDYYAGTAPAGLDNVTLFPSTSLPSGWWLEIHRIDGGMLQLRWPVLAQGTLEAAPSLTSATWTQVNIVPVVINGLNTVNVAPSAPRMFYRLRYEP